MQNPRSSITAMFAIAVLTVGASLASGQGYPTRPVRILAGGAGGGGDFAARMVIQGMTEGLGQQVIVENRGGMIPAETVSKAQPDGYSLLVDGNSLWLGPLLQKMPYDFANDFAPLTPLATAPIVLVVNPGVAANSVKELIALAKAKAGALNYGSPSTGSANHLAAEMFNTMTGVKIVRVPYSGIALAINAAIGGEVQVVFANASGASPHLKSGKLRGLAVTNSQPSALFPGLPTLAASGLPGYEAANVFAIFAPAKTPAPIIKRLNQEIVRTLGKPDVKDRFFNAGVEAQGTTPEQFSAMITTDIARWGKVIRDAGVKAD